MLIYLSTVYHSLSLILTTVAAGTDAANLAVRLSDSVTYWLTGWLNDWSSSLDWSGLKSASIIYNRLNSVQLAVGASNPHRFFLSILKTYYFNAAFYDPYHLQLVVGLLYYRILYTSELRMGAQ